jgi:hypothetical protein
MVHTVEGQTSDHVRPGSSSAGDSANTCRVFDQLEVDTQSGQPSLTGNLADQAQLHRFLDQPAARGGTSSSSRYL